MSHLRSKPVCLLISFHPARVSSAFTNHYVDTDLSQYQLSVALDTRVRVFWLFIEATTYKICALHLPS